MPVFEVRLESPVDSQARIITTQADSADAARAQAERQELKLVEFSLLPPDRETWECPPGSDPDSPDGLVNLGRWDAYDPVFARHAAELPYEEACRAAKIRLDGLTRSVDLTKAGRVKGSDLNARHVARVVAHQQTEPYRVVDVAQVGAPDLDVNLVARLVRMHEDPARWRRLLDELRDKGIPLAAVTASLAGLPWQKQIDGSSVSVWSSATVKTTLHTAYTFDPDTHDFYNDASASEVTGTGYTAGGNTLGTKTSTYDTATDQIRLDAADTSWASSTISATDANVWVDTAGASSTDPLYGNVDFGATVSTTNGTFQITWDATGIFNFDIT